MQRLVVLGVPSSAGAYCVGVEGAPDLLRAAGLIERLTTAGLEVKDAGNLTTRLWKPDRESRYAQNIAEEVASIDELAVALTPLLAAGDRVLVLGGSCTVAVGVCAGLHAAGPAPRIVYIDRHLDLNTPDSTTEGSLSWMGMAHALDVEGAAPDLAQVGGGAPLLRPEHLAYLGVDLGAATAFERQQAAERGLAITPQDELVGDPAAAARKAHAAVGSGPFAVHLDVDVLDFIDAPLAENVNGRNTGPTIEQVGSALRALVQHPDCVALSIGQLVPAHAASDPTALPRLIDALVSAFATEQRVVLERFV